MLKYILILCLLVSISETRDFVVQQTPAPSMYGPSRGEVWPMPQIQEYGSLLFTINASFYIDLGDITCTVIKNAATRYMKIFKNHAKVTKNLPGFLVLDHLEVVLTEPCVNNSYPHIYMDERYNLTVSRVPVLTSASVWGILRGFETFSQLFYWECDAESILIRQTTIVDYPQYTHRALMLDTSRRRVSISNILKTLDAMAMNKMNVFHWYLGNNETLPIHGNMIPKSSEKNAQFFTMAYSRKDIRHVIEHARVRGIRVIPEIRVPEHGGSWAHSHPDIVIPCDGSLNPIRTKTYTVLKNILDAMTDLFKDKYLHLGGYRMNLGCWWSIRKMRMYIHKYQLRGERALHAMFLWYVIRQLRPGVIPIVWEDAIKHRATIPDNSIVHVYNEDISCARTLQVLRSNLSVIVSQHFDIGRRLPFKDMYIDPRSEVWLHVNKKQLMNLLGGEALVWGDQIENNDVLGYTWPSTCAIAEVLWSTTRSNSKPSDFRMHVLQEQTCRMLGRGLFVKTMAGYICDP